MNCYQLMEKYYFSAEEAYSFSKRVNALIRYRDYLQYSKGPLSEFNLNSLFRVLRRCDSIIARNINRLNSILTLALDKNCECALGAEYFVSTTDSQLHIVEIDSCLILTEIENAIISNPYEKIEDLIWDVIHSSQAFKSCLFWKDSLSLSQIEKYLENNSEHLLRDIQIMNPGLFEKLKQFPISSLRKEQIRINLDFFKQRKGIQLPLFAGGLATCVEPSFQFFENKRPKEKKPSSFTKEWYRKRITICKVVCDLFFEVQMDPEFLEIFGSITVRESIDFKIDSLFEESVFCSRKEDPHWEKVHLLRLRKYESFVRSYFSEQFKEDAPSDWFDSMCF